MLKNKQIYDVIIIGGGVAGCATAIALKNNAPDLKIGIIERKTENSSSNGYGKQRIGENLPPQTTQVFQTLGIWTAFQQCNFLPSYGTASAWGNTELYHNEFMYSPFGYGWHIDRHVFDQFMITEASKRKVDFYFNTSITDAQKEGKGWQVIGKEGTRSLPISCQFIVDATGRKAVFACQQGAKKRVDDQLIGIYRFYNQKNKPSFGVQGTCVEADENGWWYSASLPDDKGVIAYMTDADIAHKNEWRKPEKFDHLLSKTTHTLGRITKTKKITSPQVVAAHTQCLDRTVGEKWLAIGDANMAFDPISSMGMYKSLQSSQYAAYAIIDTLHDTPSGLKKYAQIMEMQYNAYHEKKEKYYREETRFPLSDFWARRQKTLQKILFN